MTAVADSRGEALLHEWRGYSRGQLIDRHRCILEAEDLGFNRHDRLELIRLQVTPGRGTRRTEDYFPPPLVETNFGATWRTTCAIETGTARSS